MSTACLVGSTGLVGSNIYTTLSQHPSIKTIHAYTRKELPLSEKLKPIQSADSSAWPQQYPSNGVDVFFSALGTTRGAAGGFDKQKLIDFDLNLELAKTAKERGTKAYVLISSGGASSGSAFGYMKMKGQLEDAVKDIGFEHVVILKPGLLIGPRTDARPPEFAMQKIANLAGAVSGNKLKDFWAQDADVIARAAVRAGLDCVEGKQTEKVRVLSQADIVRIGRTEWKG